MLTYHAYAAPSAKAPLEPFAFDPGPLGPEEVEIEVSYCAVCQSDLSMLDDDALKKIAGSLDLIISTVNAGLDVPGILDTLAPKGRLHNVGVRCKSPPSA